MRAVRILVALAVVGLCLQSPFAVAQQSTAVAPKTIKLDSAPAPAGLTWPRPRTESMSKLINTKVVANVSEPTLTAFLPDKSNANGTAVVVCPGGAFHILSIDSEGRDVAKWLNARGVAAFVLEYRLVPTGEDGVAEMFAKLANRKALDEENAPIVALATADGLAAVGYVRKHAAELGVAPNRIGIMGFSAGGTVAAAVAFGYTAETRPDFVAPIYPYMGAVKEAPVPSDAPPLFVAAASDDQLGLAPDSVALYSKWLAARKPAELHIYAKGGHGFGMRTQNIPTDHWIERFGDWLGAQGLLAPAT